MTRRRIYAVVALLLTPLAVLSAVGFTLDDPQQAFGVLLTLSLAVLAAAYALVRRGLLRIVGLVLAAMFALGVVEELLDRRVMDRLFIIAMLWIAVSAACAAFTVRVPLPRAARPRRPVLFMNPRSGGGKAEKFHLADEARKRGIEPVELKPGDDLPALVNEAADDGADALAMAGGDGSQGAVAAIAIERRLPFACIPAGTRNHFALDLGVDRDDVVGALDAFVDGGERCVDVAEVNGRVFVNNVSLGVYATAVQKARYRGAKLRTLLDTMPDLMGPRGSPPDLQWRGPRGMVRCSGRVLLVSNNTYRLGLVLGSGTRPRMDAGELGIAVVEGRVEAKGWRRLLPRRAWDTWSSPEFEVRSANGVPAGVDGEATVLHAPLRFFSRPAALRVRIAPQHPGASPSAARPANPWEGFRKLLSIATGRPGAEAPGTQRQHAVDERPGGEQQHPDRARGGEQRPGGRDHRDAVRAENQHR
jgi:diacylglycerol kinase family enzyme